jgi:hypothetical protein
VLTDLVITQPQTNSRTHCVRLTCFCKCGSAHRPHLMSHENLVDMPQAAKKYILVKISGLLCLLQYNHRREFIEGHMELIALFQVSSLRQYSNRLPLWAAATVLTHVPFWLPCTPGNCFSSSFVSDPHTWPPLPSYALSPIQGSQLNPATQQPSNLATQQPPEWVPTLLLQLLHHVCCCPTSASSLPASAAY